MTILFFPLQFVLFFHASISLVTTLILRRNRFTQKRILMTVEGNLIEIDSNRAEDFLKRFRSYLVSYARCTIHRMFSQQITLVIKKTVICHLLPLIWTVIERPTRGLTNGCGQLNACHIESQRCNYSTYIAYCHWIKVIIDNDSWRGLPVTHYDQINTVGDRAGEVAVIY